jgi:hypothetical protein
MMAQFCSGSGPFVVNLEVGNQNLVAQNNLGGTGIVKSFEIPEQRSLVVDCGLIDGRL